MGTSFGFQTCYKYNKTHQQQYFKMAQISINKKKGGKTNVSKLQGQKFICINKILLNYLKINTKMKHISPKI
jgi:hypothetical protein